MMGGTAKLIFASLVVTLFLLMSNFFVSPAFATTAINVPHYLTFEGQLTNSGGTYQTGTFSMVFKIYDALTGGTALWTETQPTITVSSGYFTAQLGSITALDLDFSKQYWVTVNVASDGEMTPRIPLNSVGYSYASDVAYGSYVTTTAPTAANGKLYYDSDDGNLYVYDGVGAAWRDLTAGVGGSGLTEDNTFTGQNIFSATTTMATSTMTGLMVSTTSTLQGTLNIGAILQGATPLVFEGATANDFETSFVFTDPTADRTITFPDDSGTVVLASALPSNGQILVGNTNSGYTFFTTSTLGLLTTNVQEGTNQYWTDSRFDASLAATTTLPNLTTLLGLTNVSSTFLTISDTLFVSSAITGTANTALTISVSNQPSANSDGVGITLRADSAGAGGTGNNAGGQLLLLGGNASGSGTSGYVRLGEGGTPFLISSFNTSSLYVRGYLEVDNQARFDGTTTFSSASVHQDGVQMIFGAGSDAVVKYDTTQTPDSLVFGVSVGTNGAGSRAFIIADKDDLSTPIYDFGDHDAATYGAGAGKQLNNATLIIHSNNQSQTQYIAFSHDASDGTIRTGVGDLVMIPKSGLMGIGTAVPSSTLHIVTTTEQMRLGNSSTNYASFGVDSGGALSVTTTVANAANAVALIFDNTNSFVITGSKLVSFRTAGVEKAYVSASGTYWGAGGITVGTDSTDNQIDDASNGGSTATLYIGNASINVTASDVRLKENIELSKISALDVLQKLQIKDFDWKQGNKWSERGRATGLIAQEVYEILPQVVDKPIDPNNTWSVEYHHLVPYVIKAVQEQQAEIQALSLNNLQGNFSGNASQETIAVVDANFQGKLKVMGQVAFGQDTVGQAKILAGATEVQVNFIAPYEYQPIVTLTLASDAYLTKYYVSSASSTGFIVKIEPQQTEKDVLFNWHAFGSDGGKVYISDGSSEDIKLFVLEEETISVLENTIIPPIETPVSYTESVPDTEPTTNIESITPNETPLVELPGTVAESIAPPTEEISIPQVEDNNSETTAVIGVVESPSVAEPTKEELVALSVETQD